MHGAPVAQGQSTGGVSLTLAARIVAHYKAQEEKTTAKRRQDKVIRTYHGARNVVVDHASGRRQSYKRVVVRATLG